MMTGAYIIHGELRCKGCAKIMRLHMPTPHDCNCKHSTFTDCPLNVLLAADEQEEYDDRRCKN